MCACVCELNSEYVSVNGVRVFVVTLGGNEMLECLNRQLFSHFLSGFIRRSCLFCEKRSLVTVSSRTFSLPRRLEFCF